MASRSRVHMLRYDIHVLPLFTDLFEHQAWADATMLATVRACPAAVDDEKVRQTLHHMITVQRAFLALFVKWPLDMAAELKAPETFDVLVARFRDTHPAEIAFAKDLTDASLTRVIEPPWFPGVKLTLPQAMLQVLMHSQAHRGQCATRLRAAGGQPPTLDFILWLKDRPAPAWT
jgi:uncharacterized damage-inducible protein DinB